MVEYLYRAKQLQCKQILNNREKVEVKTKKKKKNPQKREDEEKVENRFEKQFACTCNYFMLFLGRKHIRYFSQSISNSR